MIRLRSSNMETVDDRGGVRFQIEIDIEDLVGQLRKQGYQLATFTPQPTKQIEPFLTDKTDWEHNYLEDKINELVSVVNKLQEGKDE